MSRAHGGFVDLNKNNLKEILAVAEQPLMDLGGIGEFDEFGSMPNSIIKIGEKFNLKSFLSFC